MCQILLTEKVNPYVTSKLTKIIKYWRVLTWKNLVYYHQIMETKPPSSTRCWTGYNRSLVGQRMSNRKYTSLDLFLKDIPELARQRNSVYYRNELRIDATSILKKCGTIKGQTITLIYNTNSWMKMWIKKELCSSKDK